MIKFYDTNALLLTYNTNLNENFIISNLTLKELQNIKQNPKKDLEIKYKTRHLINWLMQNKHLYQIEKYQYTWDQKLKKYPILSDNIDSRIIFTAFQLKKTIPDLIFVTYDANCSCIAEDMGPPALRRAAWYRPTPQAGRPTRTAQSIYLSSQ